MRRRILAGLAGFIGVALVSQTADAWYHSGYYGTASGGGGSWSAHGWRGGSASGGGGSWSGTGWRGSTASGGGGSWTAHGVNGGTASGYHYNGNYGYNGSYYGAYHPPVVVNSYAPGCYNCGGWNTGAAAAGAVAGLATGMVAGAAIAGAANANAAASAPPPPPPIPPVNTVYAALPGNCVYKPAGSVNYYECGNYWVEPSFGANGVYYRVVTAP